MPPTFLLNRINGFTTRGNVSYHLIPLIFQAYIQYQVNGLPGAHFELLIGIEPTTCSLQVSCSANWAIVANWELLRRFFNSRCKGTIIFGHFQKFVTLFAKNSRSRHFWTTLIVVNILLREAVLTGANRLKLTPIPDLNVWIILCKSYRHLWTAFPQSFLQNADGSSRFSALGGDRDDSVIFLYAKFADIYQIILSI